MKAVILAAGKGTRLGELTRTIPKAMIRIAGLPAIEHVMRGIHSAGVEDFVLVTGHLAEHIEQYFGDGSRFGMRVRYATQGEPYGTGAALLAARDLSGDGPIMVTFADVLVSSCSYAGALDVYKDLRGAGVITVNTVPDPCTGADVQLDEENRVSRVTEKPPAGSAPFYLNSSGLFVFDPIVFNYLEALTPSHRGEYEIADALTNMVEDGLAVYPYHLQGYWRDIGTVEDIAAAEAELSVPPPLGGG